LTQAVYISVYHLYVTSLQTCLHMGAFLGTWNYVMFTLVSGFSYWR